MNDWALNDIDQQLIKLSLREDLGIVFQDATTNLLFPKHLPEQTARIISKAKEPIVFCGRMIVEELLCAFQSDYELTGIEDGQVVQPGETIMTITSDPATLLMAERSILNFIRRLSAIATLTRKFVDKVKHTQLKILDTRKTTPGWRHLEKYAVLCGGGVNHRMGLYDAIMVKDTHVDLLGGMKLALDKLPEKADKEMSVVVEVRDINELKTVIEFGQGKVDRVLLDNMSPEQMKECVALCEGIYATEASGNLNLDNIVAVAESGVTLASIGAVTHSAGSVDVSMKSEEAKPDEQ
jgi:nicotinate-nucleotide pyrophosphorylase (carboxylating)